MIETPESSGILAPARDTLASNACLLVRGGNHPQHYYQYLSSIVCDGIDKSCVNGMALASSPYLQWFHLSARAAEDGIRTDSPHLNE